MRLRGESIRLRRRAGPARGRLSAPRLPCLRAPDPHLRLAPGTLLPPGGAARRPGAVRRPPGRDRARRARSTPCWSRATSTTGPCRSVDTVALLLRGRRPASIDAGAQVVLSSGNHDSADPARLRLRADRRAPACTSAPARHASARPVLRRRRRGLPAALPRARGPRPTRWARRAHPRRGPAAPRWSGSAPTSRPGRRPLGRAWRTRSSPAAPPATPSATSAWAGSAPSTPRRLRGPRLRRPGPPARPQQISDDGALLRLAAARCPSARPTTPRVPGSSTWRPRRAAVEPVEAPVPRPVLAGCAATSRTCWRDPRHAGAESAWCQVTLTDADPPAGRDGAAAAPVPARAGAAVRARRARRSAPRSYAGARPRARRPRRVLRLPRARPRRRRCRPRPSARVLAEAVEASGTAARCARTRAGRHLGVPARRRGGRSREAPPAQGHRVRAVRRHRGGRLRRAGRRRALPHPRSHRRRQDQRARRDLLRPLRRCARVHGPRAAGRCTATTPPPAPSPRWCSS